MYVFLLLLLGDWNYLSTHCSSKTVGIGYLIELQQSVVRLSDFDEYVPLSGLIDRREPRRCPYRVHRASEERAPTRTGHEALRPRGRTQTQPSRMVPPMELISFVVARVLQSNSLTSSPLQTRTCETYHITKLLDEIDNITGLILDFHATT